MCIETTDLTGSHSVGVYVGEGVRDFLSLGDTPLMSPMP